MIRSQKIVVAAATAVFLCQLVAVVVLSPHFGNEVDAAERFTAETRESVPKSISEGGDLTASGPAEAAATLRENDQCIDGNTEVIAEFNMNRTRSRDAR